MNKLLYFTATWCGPCKALGPTIDTLAGQGLPLQKIDVDNNQPLSAQYSVRNVPTLIKVDSAGNELGRLVGNQTAPAIMTWWNSY
jgi:thioredoxin-like negative regulator of GroEL|tara:strand:- start:537 stop:791 length:255 start_codon:yes stop_codon:yes gene_type:complete